VKHVYASDEKIMLTLHNVVAERPNYVYESDAEGNCQYVRDGAPSCVVGHVLHRLGVPVTELSRYDTPYGGVDAMRVVGELVPSASWEVREALFKAQSVQDRQETWDAALVAAELRWAQR
jgi:hypothetical protein